MRISVSHLLTRKAALTTTNMKDPDLILQQYLHECEHLRGQSLRTLKASRTIIRAYQKFSNLQSIHEATANSVRAYILHGRSECAWKASTTHTIHKKLRVYFEWCIKNDYLKENPAIDIDLPRLEYRVPKYLNEQDAHRLLESVYNYPYSNQYLRYRNHAIFSVYIFAGLRKMELLNLRFMDVDFENMTIFVRQGKGRKDRMVPMNYTLSQSLSRYVEERKRLRLTVPEFFVSAARGRALTEAGLLYIVKQLRKASGIHFTIHQLRHTFATLMVEGGCDIIPISKMLGHSKIETTMIYAHASAKHLRAEIGKHPLGEGVD